MSATLSSSAVASINDNVKMWERRTRNQTSLSDGGVNRRIDQQQSKLSTSKSAIAFWDEATIVELSKQSSQHAGKPKFRKHIKPERTESFPCPVSGCTRMFISQAELDNHMDVQHSGNEELDTSNQAVQAYLDSVDPAAYEQADLTVQPPELTEGDFTVKPMPVTAASLRALNDSTSTDLSRSMDDLSISEAHKSSASVMSLETTYSVIDDAEDAPLSEYEDSVSLTPRIQLPVRMLLCLWMKLWFDLSKRFTTSGTRQQAPYPGTTSHPSSASVSKESLGTSSHASSQLSSTRSIKRRRSDDGDDDADGRTNKTRNRREQSSPENKPLACPFNKYDHYMFGGDSANDKYHVCSTWNDVKTAYFKQHLLRNHCIPEYHCDRCGGDFKNQINLRDHRRQDPPCAVKDLDNQKIMPETQIELGLRSRNVVGLDRIAYWFKVYDTVFGSDARKQRPVEPYYEGPSAEALRSFLRFSELRMQDVIRRSRQMLNSESDDYNEQNSQLVQTILQEASQSFMEELRTRRTPSLREIKQQNSPRASAVDIGENTVIVKDTPRRPQPMVSPTPENWQSPNVMSSDHMAPAQRQFSMQSMQLPERPANPQMTSTPHGGVPVQLYGDHQAFQHGHDYVEPNWVDFDYLNMHELDASVEDSDLYGTGSLNQNDYDGFDFVDNPSNSSRRERRLP